MKIKITERTKGILLMLPAIIIILLVIIKTLIDAITENLADTMLAIYFIVLIFLFFFGLDIYQYEETHKIK